MHKAVTCIFNSSRRTLAESFEAECNARTTYDMAVCIALVFVTLVCVKHGRTLIGLAI